MKCSVIALLTAFVLVATPDLQADEHDRAVQHQQFAERYIQAYNARDFDALEAMIAETIVLNGEETERSDFLGVVRQYMTWFPDVRLDATRIVGAEDHVTLRFEVTATGSGEMMGHDIDGKEISTTELILFRISDERITETWYEWDELSFWAQLGVIERP